MMNKIILTLAKDAIESRLFNKQISDKYEVINKYPEFAQLGATFVTLKIDGSLRGCIGSIIAHRDLYDDLVSNAQNAAFNDPRFKPLSIDEYEKVDIEVSLLTQPEIVNYKNIEDLKSKVEIGVDGIILKNQHYQSTFLPQVWEELNDFDLFFTHLCTKAGLEGNCLSQYPQIYKYQVQKIK